MKKDITKNKSNLAFIVGVGLLLIFCILNSNSNNEAIECIGIIAFAFNSFRTALLNLDKHKKTHYYIASFISTFGGGIIRDLFLLITIPALMYNLSWVFLAICSINFSLDYHKGRYNNLDEHNEQSKVEPTLILFGILENIAIIVFVQGGYYVAYAHSQNRFLSLVCAIITGCGGGILTTLIYYRNIRERVVSTFSTIVFTLFGAAILTLFNFKQDNCALVTWVILSIIKAEKDNIYKALNTTVNLNYRLSLGNIHLVNDFYEPSLFTYSYMKYFIELYRNLVLQAKRVKYERTKKTQKRNERSLKKYFYYRSAVKTFA